MPGFKSHLKSVTFTNRPIFDHSNPGHILCFLQPPGHVPPPGQQGPMPPPPQQGGPAPPPQGPPGPPHEGAPAPPSHPGAPPPGAPDYSRQPGPPQSMNQPRKLKLKYNSCLKFDCHFIVLQCVTQTIFYF